ncbi:hypothetical protein DFH28DRAFT_924882 [Melampsora americana]|nr:hypothetical protein DFH28DRAFT_924882 [Melampsora americana]
MSDASEGSVPELMMDHEAGVQDVLMETNDIPEASVDAWEDIEPASPSLVIGSGTSSSSFSGGSSKADDSEINLMNIDIQNPPQGDPNAVDDKIEEDIPLEELTDGVTLTYVKHGTKMERLKFRFDSVRMSLKECSR